jgi:hypothetical protein
MPERPSQIWKHLPVDTRTQAAEAFWRDTESPEIGAEHAEAIVALSRRLHFRPKSLQGLPVEKRAKHLAHLSEVSDPIATRALIAFHFSSRRPLMAAFLDALGIAHNEGLITAEDVPAPAAARLKEAVETLRTSFSGADVDLYLRTLAALDGDTWGNLDDLVGPLG